MMTKKEKLRIYNDCMHEIGLLKKGQSVCHYKKPWEGKPLTVRKEIGYFCIDDYYVSDFLGAVKSAYKHCVNE